MTQQILWFVSIFAGSVLWTWMYNGTGGSVLAVAIFHAGVNAMEIYHPADFEEMAPGGIPDPWLNLLAEVTGAMPMVIIAILLILIYGPSKLTNRDIPGREAIGLGGDRR